MRRLETRHGYQGSRCSEVVADIRQGFITQGLFKEKALASRIRGQME